MGKITKLWKSFRSHACDVREAAALKCPSSAFESTPLSAPLSNLQLDTGLLLCSNQTESSNPVPGSVGSHQTIQTIDADKLTAAATLDACVLQARTAAQQQHSQSTFVLAQHWMQGPSSALRHSQDFIRAHVCKSPAEASAQYLPYSQPELAAFGFSTSSSQQASPKRYPGHRAPPMAATLSASDILQHAPHGTEWIIHDIHKSTARSECADLPDSNLHASILGSTLEAVRSGSANAASPPPPAPVKQDSQQSWIATGATVQGSEQQHLCQDLPEGLSLTPTGHGDVEWTTPPCVPAGTPPVGCWSRSAPQVAQAATATAATACTHTPSAADVSGLKLFAVGGEQARTIAVASHCPEDLMSPLWSVDNFVLLRKLYEGSLSVVCQARHKQSGRTVALKVYKRSRLHDMERFQLAREICLHIRLLHPNIVSLYAAWKDSKYVYLALEWVPGGNLFDLMVKRGGKLPEQEAAPIALALFKSLAYLHSHNFIHRDVKLENIVLNEQNQVKLCDFGLAIDQTFEPANTRLGTFGYFAPEVLDCPLKISPFDYKGDYRVRGYNCKVDCWSAGVVTYELLTGRAPFGAASVAMVLEAIRTRALEFPAHLSPDASDFLTCALTRNPLDRPSAAALVEHSWFASCTQAMHT
ncbi:hypothetical protein QJQ45_023759 [Haematococcus lacustris]|nr:hypothetical protein QJQ45_023759 [Haematococcus lacustris]